jgi:Thiamine pyrophosphate enzyme, N-terminal TPP binding domain
VVLKALRIAHDAGIKTALDIDYRPNVWSVAGHGEGKSRFVESAKVTAKLQSSLHLFDLIVGTEEELNIAGGSTDTVTALKAVRAVSDATLVAKRGARGAVAFGGSIPDSLDDGEAGAGFPIEVFNFGHGNVAGIGEALHGISKALPTWRGQNEQTMAHAAIAYAKIKRRRRAHAVTSSIGPGATNMVTAAAVAHVNRLPVLFISGDVFANRRPDPVLQQIEDFDDGTVSANDCFRPVSRYFDRLTRPEHLLTALPRAMRTLTDPANCGPVTLAFCQDVQAESFEYPKSFFEPKVGGSAGLSRIGSKSKKS